jgi:hypothetical protein
VDREIDDRQILREKTDITIEEDVGKKFPQFHAVLFSKKKNFNKLKAQWLTMPCYGQHLKHQIHLEGWGLVFTIGILMMGYHVPNQKSREFI